MRDYVVELEKRIEFIKKAMQDAGATGLVFGNSGGKDSALVGILAKKACVNTLGVIMPCKSSQNYKSDMADGLEVAKMFYIENITVDLSKVKDLLVEEIEQVSTVSTTASTNINPRLRMTTLYSIAQTRNSLVLGTGNKNELFMGYFTKYGDGGCDINPIADLSVREIYEFLEFLNAPKNIIQKAPSAGLYEGQTDEKDMGVTYSEIEKFMNNEDVSETSKVKIANANKRTEHKRQLPKMYK